VSKTIARIVAGFAGQVSITSRARRTRATRNFAAET